MHKLCFCSCLSVRKNEQQSSFLILEKKKSLDENFFLKEMFITYQPPIKHEALQLIKQTQTFWPKLRELGVPCFTEPRAENSRKVQALCQQTKQVFIPTVSSGQCLDDRQRWGLKIVYTQHPGLLGEESDRRKWGHMVTERYPTEQKKNRRGMERQLLWPRMTTNWGANIFGGRMSCPVPTGLQTRASWPWGRSSSKCGTRAGQLWWTEVFICSGRAGRTSQRAHLCEGGKQSEELRRILKKKCSSF